MNKLRFAILFIFFFTLIWACSAKPESAIPSPTWVILFVDNGGGHHTQEVLAVVAEDALVAFHEINPDDSLYITCLARKDRNTCKPAILASPVDEYK